MINMNIGSKYSRSSTTDLVEDPVTVSAPPHTDGVQGGQAVDCHVVTGGGGRRGRRAEVVKV